MKRCSSPIKAENDSTCGGQKKGKKLTAGILTIQNDPSFYVIVICAFVCFWLFAKRLHRAEQGAAAGLKADGFRGNEEHVLYIIGDRDLGAPVETRAWCREWWEKALNAGCGGGWNYSIMIRKLEPLLRESKQASLSVKGPYSARTRSRTPFFLSWIHPWPREPRFCSLK